MERIQESISKTGRLVVITESRRNVGFGAELIARIVEGQLKEIATTARAMRKREGKVYLDFGQNGHGQLLVAPFSVRPLPCAPVSAPLRWSEVNSKLTLEQFTIKSVPKRMNRMKGDPMLDVLTGTPDLVSILARLAEEVA